MNFFDDAVGALGKSLAKSATSYLDDTTGMDVGGTLAFLFGNDQAAAGQDLGDLVNSISADFKPGAGAELTLLQDSLNAQTEQIGQIASQLTAMGAAIADIYGEIKGIEAMLKAIGQDVLYGNWLQQDNSIKTYLVQIRTAYNQYTLYIDPANGVKPSGIADLVASILDPNNGEVTAANGINSFMMSDGSNKGALADWANMVCPLIEDGALDYRQAVDQFQAYYVKLTWAQLRATNLVIEAHNFNGDNILAKDAWYAYQALILGQESTYIQNLVQIVRSGLVGSTKSGYGFLAYHAAWQFHPDMSPLYSGNVRIAHSYYAISPIFNTAEALLARLALTDPADRRLVVHMTYFGDAFKTAIDGATITLTPQSAEANTAVAPDDASLVVGPMGSPEQHSGSFVVDPIWVTDSTFYVKRLVYSGSDDSALADCKYRLTNQNGQGPLQAMQTYNGVATSFQSDAVLNYEMQINAAQPFDFMNFGAYFGG